MAGDKLEFDGVVSDARGNGMFMVQLNPNDGNCNSILCRLSGKIIKNNIKILAGDYVKVEISPYDLTRGVIVYRNK